MQLQKLLTDDDAVSPVIGVILMVAITVILAAVIASFVLGIGDQQQVQPTAQFDFDYDSAQGNVTVTHTSGDAVPNSSVTLRGSSFADLTDNERPWHWETDTNIEPENKDAHNGDLSGNLDGEDAIVSGDSAVVGVDDDSWEISVIWASSGGGSTATLAQESGPAA